MGSRIAKNGDDSSDVTQSASSSLLSHVVIVPGEEGSGGGGSSVGSGVERAPFVGQQHETVISKQSSGSSTPTSGSSSGSFGPPLLHAATTPNEMGVVLEGTELGHFHLEQFVGGGGMGAVFRATDGRLGRTVAVKVLSRDRTDMDTLRRFQNEAQSAARLDHENIARVYYVGEDRGLHYIVFEFIEGINIRDLVQQKGPLPLEEAISYVLQVAEALEHASLRNVIHRDIKPSNVLVTGDRRAKLVDMGLARLHQMESDAHDLTASGVTLGTFDYISPEQARDPRTADVRSDLYSLGCTFYFMLTGQPPFPEGTVLQKLLSHSTDEPTDPRAFRPDLDEQVVQVLERLLAKQPARRFQRPSELIGQLLLVAERLNMQTIARNGMVWVAPRNTAFTMLAAAVPWGVPLAMFLAAIVVINGIWSGREPFEFGAVPVQLQPSESPMASETPPAGGTAAGTDPVPADSAKPAADVPAGERATALAGTDPAEAGVAAIRTAEEDLAETTDEQPETRPGEAPPATLPIGASRTSPPPLVAPKNIEELYPSSLREPGGTGEPEAEAAGEGSADNTDSGAPLRIIVTDAPAQGSADTLAVATLAEACRQAQQRGVAHIELHYDGPREEPPLELGGGEMTISRGNGYEPLVVFRPTYNDPSSSSAMIRANGSRLNWRGVHVLLDLTDAPQQSWSLFRLRSFASLDVRDSVLTIRNLDLRGDARHAPVEFFLLEPLSTTEAEGGAALPSRVALTDCILRGQATVLRSEQATAFRLILQNSLVVARGWLADVAGAATKPALKHGRADVVLKHVTAVLHDGLCRMAGDPPAPYQLDLHVESSDAIVYVTNSNSPLFERAGVGQVSEIEKRWDLRGRDNVYPGSTTLLRLRPEGPEAEVLDIDFESRDQLSFLDEKSPAFMLMWKELPPPELTEDMQISDYYELDKSDIEDVLIGGRNLPGADVSRLPVLRPSSTDPADRSVDPPAASETALDDSVLF